MRAIQWLAHQDNYSDRAKTGLEAAAEKDRKVSEMQLFALGMSAFGIISWSRTPLLDFGIWITKTHNIDFALDNDPQSDVPP